MTSHTSTSSKIAIGLAPLLVAAGLLLADSVLANPVVTERVGIDSEGADVISSGADPSVSEEGRFIAFSSEATDLVLNDTNGVKDVFVHDWAEGTTIRVSVASDGTEANGPSNSPFINNDGRFVAFYSDADNLVAGDINGASDIFVRYLHPTDGYTEMVSVDNAGIQGNGDCSSPSISADGRYVAFASVADNLVPGDTNGAEDVFLYDRQNDQLVLISAAVGSTQPANGLSEDPIISADGQFIAFSSRASDLISNDTNNMRDIFVRDWMNGTTERVSVSSAGDQAGSLSYRPTINNDGRFIAFRSYANNLVLNDTNNQADIFLHDRTDGSTVRVNLSSAGDQALGGPSYEAAINGDGRFVAFHSYATNLVPDDDNDDSDVFVRDLEDNGLTVRVSVDSDGVQADGPSYRPAISFEGKVVVFYSEAGNLISDDSNDDPDTFAHGEKPEATPEPTATPTATATATETSTPTNTPTDTPTNTPIPTDTPVPTHTDTPLPTDTDTPVPTDTDTPVPTDTDTPVPTDTDTAVPTDTDTPVPTDTDTPVPTDTDTPVPTHTDTPVPTHTDTPVPTDTDTPVPTHTDTPVPTHTDTPVPTHTNTPVPTHTDTPDPTPTDTPEPTDTPVPTDTPTNTPVPTDPPGVCPRFLDFETDADGNALQAGTFIDDEWAAYGITITTNNPTAHPAMLFDTGNPTGNDDDLGAPNKDFGGPGIGEGGEKGAPGENSVPLGNVLILSQDANPNDPNDYYGGGTFIFEFDRATDIYEIHILDIDRNERDGVVTGYDSNGAVVGREWIPALGNNSFQVMQLGFENVVRLKVKIQASGAIAGLKFCQHQGDGSTPTPTPNTDPKPTATPDDPSDPPQEPEATATPNEPKPTNTPVTPINPGPYDPSKPDAKVSSCLVRGSTSFRLKLTNYGASGKYRLRPVEGRPILGPWYLETGQVVGHFGYNAPIVTGIDTTWIVQYRDGSKWIDTKEDHQTSVEDHTRKQDFCDFAGPDPDLPPIEPIIIILTDEKTIVEGDSLSGLGNIIADMSQPWTAEINYGDGSEIEILSVMPNEKFELEHVYGDNGEYDLTITASDGDGNQVSKTNAITVNNASPELDVHGLTSFKSCRYINHFFHFRFKWRVCSDIIIDYARVGEEKIFTTTAVDAGSDDLTFKWSPGSETTYFNDGAATDPPNSSMGDFPFSVTDETSFVFDEPGWHRLTLNVIDDDGGSVTRKIKVFVMEGGPCAQGLGYWKHRLSSYGWNYFEAARLKAYISIVNNFSSVFSEKVSSRSISQALNVLRFENTDLRAKANAHLLTAWFNFAQASIKWNEPIDLDGDGASDGSFNELIKNAESILLDPDASQEEIEWAKDIAQGITQHSQDLCKRD